MIGPKYAEGKLVDHAIKNKIGMLTTLPREKT